MGQNFFFRFGDFIALRFCPGEFIPGDFMTLEILSLEDFRVQTKWLVPESQTQDIEDPSTSSSYSALFHKYRELGYSKVRIENRGLLGLVCEANLLELII
jgi:hypothetical protein